MPIFPATPENIAAAAAVLRAGGLVALPTETVYGLGANALNALACAGIFAAKERPFFDPLIVHVADLQMAERLTMGFSATARLLAEKFWPGPLTIVLRRNDEGRMMNDEGEGWLGRKQRDAPAAAESAPKDSTPTPLGLPVGQPLPPEGNDKGRMTKDEGEGWLGRKQRDAPAAAESVDKDGTPTPLGLPVGQPQPPGQPQAPGVPDIVTAGLPTVAIRMPSHPVALELIRLAGCPVAAPSANLFGRLSPTTAQHVAEQLGERVDFILDGGPCAVGVESTIINLSGETPTLLRPGGVSLEALQSVIGDIAVSICESDQPTAPGQLASHYAPRTPLVLFTGQPPKVSPGQRAGLVTLRPSPHAKQFAIASSLSASGDLAEAATNLFAALHKLDSAGLDIIHAESLPEVGLGRAIMDRLRRAAFRSSG